MEVGDIVKDIWMATESESLDKSDKSNEDMENMEKRQQNQIAHDQNPQHTERVLIRSRTS